MHLHRPLIIFDLETTGTNTSTDRILQIGAIKINPDGSREEKNVLVNPNVPIPAAATAVHGISDEDVKDAPLFRRIAIPSYVGPPGGSPAATSLAIIPTTSTCPCW